ncbi:MAG: PAS domain S-box protein, partial [Deltaproteobacteria bacterium]|nr:PAS domain S-box protein [Deltaproteobacteria bacterium]
DDKGKVVEAIGTVEDLKDFTEGKNVEKEVNETKEFVEMVIENTVDGIMIGDLSGNIISANAALGKMTGLKKEELIGEHASMFISEDEEIRKIFREKAVDLFEKGNTSYESALKRRDGKHIEVDVTTSLIKDGSGDYIAGVSIFRDISERKKAEREIREAKEFLENLFKTSSDAIMVTDPKGEITMVNDLLESMTGYSKGELLGKYASVLSPPDKEVRSEVLKELERLFEEGRIYGFETIWQRKDGQCISVESNRSLLKDKDGNVIGGVSFTRDITEKKKVESMLLQSEKLKSLGELAGGVAHDFNNVLAAILGRVQLLKTKIDHPSVEQKSKKTVGDLKRGLEIIEKASLDGAETVRRIQEFSRRRADDREFRNVDINELIENALEFTRVRWKDDAETKGIKVEIIKELSSLPPIAGSASELREVFTNFINNAVDAMPEGGQIKIKTFKKGNHIFIKLGDTGIGIPKDIRERIFDPFFTTKGPQSTGLGMSVSYGIINRHRGMIGLSSTEGKGTTFTIKLPITSEKTGEEKRKPLTGKRDKARILVVED